MEGKQVLPNVHNLLQIVGRFVDSVPTKPSSDIDWDRIVMEKAKAKACLGWCYEIFKEKEFTGGCGPVPDGAGGNGPIPPAR